MISIQSNNEIFKLPGYGKLGYYSVNGRIFFSKLDASMYATSSALADIEWNFNDEILGRCDWTREPFTDMDELYRLRAQQIRDTHDYVLIMFSGGADSLNVIKSFLNNKIKIDEIVAAMPVSGLKDWEYNPNDISVENQISESKFCQMPALEEISKNFPEIKITIHDWFEDLLDYKTDHFIDRCTWWFNLGAEKHYLEKHQHIKKIAESGKKIAKIYGIDKPWIGRARNGDLYNVIYDGPINAGNGGTTKEQHTNIIPTPFYITPDMPEIMIKQSHVLCKWIFSGLSHQSNIARMTITDKTFPVSYRRSEERKSVYQRVIVPTIYPALSSIKLWQTHKTVTKLSPIQPHDFFIEKLHSKQPFVDSSHSDLQNALSAVDKKYLKPNDWMSVASFLPHAKLFKIGHESQFIGEKFVYDDILKSFDFSNDSLAKMSSVVYQYDYYSKIYQITDQG